MTTTYRKEFFDRDYTLKEAYGRVWKYARKYRFRLVVGIACGMMTAGTLVPLFQIVQPTMDHVESHADVVDVADGVQLEDSKSLPDRSDPKPRNAYERQMAKNSKLPGWYPKVERFASRLGITLQNERGGMAGALILIVCFVVPLIALARLAMMYLNHYCLSWVGAHAVADIRQELLEHVQRQGLQFFGRVDVGQVMMRITGDPQQIQVILSTILSEVAMAPFEIFVSIGFIIWYAIVNNMLATLALILIGFPLFAVPVHSIGRKVKRWARRSMERVSMIAAKVHEIMTCIKVVKSYNTEEFENRRYADTNKYLLKSTMRGLRIGLMVAPTVETVGVFLACGFLVWCFLMDIKISDILPMLAPLLVIYKPVKQLSKLQVQIETSMAALSRIYSILDVNMELPERADAVRKDSFTGKIVFDDVSFRYDTAEADAVSHASFDIEKGKVVAVVGGTGSGKTTMAGLLARFYDPSSGSVTMDGVDLRDLSIADLRVLVGAVTQEAILFNDTIEENIRYGSPNATHDEVVAAAKLANAHDFIMSQPEGYGRIVGEKGFALSGGERQRIAIARAILRNPPVLILDEATSALDTVTERIVQDALYNLMKNRTVFAIAHRLSTIRAADLILVMDHGRIVERGTHDVLYAANGAYRKLCDMQHQN
jgi:subfamily B ATP-binding cassette protein MsbA